MSLKSTLGIYASGFVVYGVVAACAGWGRSSPMSGSPRARLSAWMDPVASARADSGSRLKAEFVLGDDGSKDYQLGLVPWTTHSFEIDLGARPVNLYFDSDRNEECAFQIAGDAAVRCIPTSAGMVIDPWGYVDAACTQRAVNIAVQAPACADLPKYAVVYDATPITCPTPGYYPGHFYPVGAFVGTNQSCYNLNAGVCTPGGSCPIVNHTPSNAYSIYAVADEVPAAAFVASTPGHDP